MLRKLLHGDRRIGGSTVDLGGIVMDLVDGDGCVYLMGLDGFLLYDRLNSFVDAAATLVNVHRSTEAIKWLTYW